MIADVVMVRTDYAREKGLDPQERCSRDIAKEMIRSLDAKHVRKLRAFEDRSRNEADCKGPRSRGIAEAYSPPRMTAVAQEFGLRPQWALDLTERDRDDGEAWDFNVESKRVKAVEMIHRDRPDMLMLGPTCAPFSSLNMGWNHNRMKIRDAQEMIEDGMKHLAFAAHMCILQAKHHRYFALEHPVSAASWDTEVLGLLRSIQGAEEVEFDFCALGMVSEDENGVAPVKKRTRRVIIGMFHWCMGGLQRVKYTPPTSASSYVGAPPLSWTPT